MLEAIKHADPNSNVLIHTDSDYVLKVLKSEFNDTDNVDLIQEIQQYSTREKDIQIVI